MDSRVLNVFQDRGNERLNAITESIGLTFEGVFQELVDKDG